MLAKFPYCVFPVQEQMPLTGLKLLAIPQELGKSCKNIVWDTLEVTVVGLKRSVQSADSNQMNCTVTELYCLAVAFLVFIYYICIYFSEFLYLFNHQKSY